MAEWKGPAEGLAVLDAIEPPTWLCSSYMWAAVQSDLHRRCGNLDKATRFREIACEAAPTEAVTKLLERRLQFENRSDA